MRKLIAALLAAAALTPAAHAQDVERERPDFAARHGAGAQDHRRDEDHPRFQAPAPPQPAQSQRAPEQARSGFGPATQGDARWQGRGEWRGRDEQRPQAPVPPLQPYQAQNGFRDRAQYDRPRFDRDRQDAWRRQQPAPSPLHPRADDWGRGDGRDGDRRLDGRRDDDRRWDGRRDDHRGWEGRRDDGRRWDDRRADVRPGINGFGWNPGWRDGRARFDSRADWSRRWRDDHRFDWDRYRASNRYLFRLPRYYAPYSWGYGYRRFSIGVTLFEPLWSQDYWIEDPFYYRLPPAYGPYRWVRYYNDALLVDIRTGLVVDAVYDIFW